MIIEKYTAEEMLSFPIIGLLFLIIAEISVYYMITTKKLWFGMRLTSRSEFLNQKVFECFGGFLVDLCFLISFLLGGILSYIEDLSWMVFLPLIAFIVHLLFTFFLFIDTRIAKKESFKEGTFLNDKNQSNRNILFILFLLISILVIFLTPFNQLIGFVFLGLYLSTIYFFNIISRDKFNEVLNSFSYENLDWLEKRSWMFRQSWRFMSGLPKNIYNKKEWKKGHLILAENTINFLKRCTILFTLEIKNIEIIEKYFVSWKLKDFPVFPCLRINMINGEIYLFSPITITSESEKYISGFIRKINLLKISNVRKNDFNEKKQNKKYALHDDDVLKKLESLNIRYHKFLENIENF